MLEKINLIIGSISASSFFIFALINFLNKLKMGFVEFMGITSGLTAIDSYRMTLKLNNRHYERLRTISIVATGPIKIQHVNVAHSIKYFCEENLLAFKANLARKYVQIDYSGTSEDFLYVDFIFENTPKLQSQIAFQFLEKPVIYGIFDFWRNFPAKRNKITLNTDFLISLNESEPPRL